MNTELKVVKSIKINTELETVWDAIVNPVKIKKYFFGVDVVTDWKAGSQIIFKGEWNGNKFEDKGKIVSVVPDKSLSYKYWSSFSGLENSEDNYSMVEYSLEKIGDKTSLTLTQTGFANETAKDHADKSWDMVLDRLIKVLSEKP